MSTESTPPSLCRPVASGRRYLVGMAIVVAFSLLHQFYLQRAYPDALYMDSLRLLGQLQQWRDGQLSTMDFWGQASSHRGFINQFFLWANVSWFQLDVLLSNRLTGAVIAIVALLLTTVFCRDLQRDGQGQGDGLLLGATVVIAGLCFSWAGFELMTLDLGLPLWTKNLCFLIYFMVHGSLLQARFRRPWLWILLLLLLGPLIILIVGMGWNYAFIGSIVGVQLLAWLPRWRSEGCWLGVLPVAALLVAMAVYMASGSVVDAAVKGGGLEFSAELVALPLYAIGSTLGNPEALLGTSRPLWILAVAGALLLLVGVGALARWLWRGAPGSWLPLYLVLYAGLMAASVSLARGADGPGAVMASRYYMDLMLGLIGILWLAIREVKACSDVRRSLAVYPIWALLLCVAIGHIKTYRNEWSAGPYRGLNFKEMNLVTLQGVPDEVGASLLQSPLAHARRGAAVMRAHQLGVFSGMDKDDCSSSDVSFGSGWNLLEAHGRWSTDEAELVLPPCACDFFVDVYLPDSLPQRTLHIQNEIGMVQEVLVAPGQSKRVDLGRASAIGRVLLKVSPVTIPSRDQAGSGDLRTLGVLAGDVTVSCPLPAH
jgi:hypothetical protein